MHDAYSFGQDNEYRRILGQDGKSRYLSVIKYILKNGSLPKPLVLIHEYKTYTVVDGNHRLLAWKSATQLLKEFHVAPSDVKNELLQSLIKWGINIIVPLKENNPAWIAKF